MLCSKITTTTKTKTVLAALQSREERRRPEKGKGTEEIGEEKKKGEKRGEDQKKQ